MIQLMFIVDIHLLGNDYDQDIVGESCDSGEHECQQPELLQEQTCNSIEHKKVGNQSHSEKVDEYQH